jgi:hypothetical protein
MSQPDSILRREANLPEGPAAAAILLQPLLAEAAGPGAQAVSLTLGHRPINGIPKSGVG